VRNRREEKGREEREKNKLVGLNMAGNMRTALPGSTKRSRRIKNPHVLLLLLSSLSLSLSLSLFFFLSFFLSFLFSRKTICVDAAVVGIQKCEGPILIFASLSLLSSLSRSLFLSFFLSHSLSLSLSLSLTHTHTHTT